MKEEIKNLQTEHNTDMCNLQADIDRVDHVTATIQLRVDNMRNNVGSSKNSLVPVKDAVPPTAQRPMKRNTPMVRRTRAGTARKVNETATVESINNKQDLVILRAENQVLKKAVENLERHCTEQ